MKKVLGITGGIGAGKSTICKVFTCLGIPHYNADERGKILMASPVLNTKINDEIGAKSYLPTGELNKKYIASVIFDNPKKLKLLNSIVHPIVVEDFKIWTRKIMKIKNVPFVIKESAIILEAKTQDSVDYLANITASVETRTKRVLKRDKQRKKEDVQKIIAQQIPDEKKNKYCDYIIKNDDSDIIIPQVLKIFNDIQNKRL